MNIFEAIEKRNNLSASMKLALLILEKYNCRASELLDATYDLFFPGKFLILRGKKNSSDIVIRDNTILNLVSNLERSSSPKIFWSLSYSQLYKECKSSYSHLFSQFKTRCNYKVTHGFRYLNANVIDDEKAVKAILNHNSKKSGKYYNKKLAKAS